MTHAASALDLWTVLGFDSEEFGPYCTEHGLDETWARMLDVVRGPQPPCLEPLDNGEYCAGTIGHPGAHHDENDTGPDNDLRTAWRWRT